MEIKQNLTFFHGKCSNLESFLISRKIFQFNCISEHKQVKKKKKIKRYMCKSDRMFPNLQSITLFE